MTFSREFGEHILDMLEPLGPLTLKRMFGGACINYGQATFALLFDGGLYLRVDEHNIERFRAAGSEPFSYLKKGRQVVVGSYYLLPEQAFDDADQMLGWARGAVDAGLRAGLAKKTKNRRGKGNHADR